MRISTTLSVLLLWVICSGGASLLAQSPSSQINAIDARDLLHLPQPPSAKPTHLGIRQAAPAPAEGLLKVKDKRFPQAGSLSVEPADRKLHAYAYQTDLRFAPNVGQVRDVNGGAVPDVKYSMKLGGGLTAYFTPKGVKYVINHYETPKLDPSNATTAASTDNSALAAAVQQGQGASVPLIDPRLNIPHSGHRVDLDFVGAGQAELLAEAKAQDYLNFYLPGRADRTFVPTYQRLVYKNIYPNIDLVFYAKGTSLKYDFVVHPGGDPNLIAMRYTGADRVEVNADGELNVHTPYGKLVEQAPFSFQEMNQRTKPVSDDQLFGSSNRPTRYEVSGNVVRFRVQNHDRSRILVIDPTLVWSTYYGGAASGETAYSVESHRNGDVYVCGLTFSNNFPTSAGAFDVGLSGQTDAFMVKLDVNGARLWATYVGGAGIETGADVAVDHDENTAYMTGVTVSADFPVANGSQALTGGGFDAYLFKFNADGTRQWATFYGGSGDDTSAFPNAANVAPNTINLGSGGVAVDRDGNVVIVGNTMSNNLPGVTGGFQEAHASFQPPINNFPLWTDMFVVKYNRAGARQWATYYGGNTMDLATAIITDKDGNIYFSGGTLSLIQNSAIASNFPASGGYRNAPILGASVNRNEWDITLTKFTPDGDRVWSTLMGGPAAQDYLPNSGGFDLSFADLGVDHKENIVYNGYTASIATDLVNAVDVPRVLGVKTPATFDQLTFKMNHAGGEGSLLWARYFGGTSVFDCGFDMGMYADGRIATMGLTLSNNQPAGAALPYQAAFGGGGQDAYMMVLSEDGATVEYQTYLGGSGVETGYGCDVSRSAAIHVCGSTASTNNFLALTTFQAAKTAGTSSDGFVVKFQDPLNTAPCEALSAGARTRVLAIQTGADLVWNYPNTLAALDKFFANYTLTETAVTTGAALTPLLANADVVIIPKIEDPASLPAFASFAAALQNFVTNGGTVIFTGTDGESNSLQNAIFNTGLLSGTYTDYATFPFAGDVVDGSSCLVNGIASPLGFPEGLAVYDFLDADIVVDAIGVSAVADRRLGAGRVFYIGADYDAWNDAAARLLANAVACQSGAGEEDLRIAISAEITSASCQPGSDGSITATVRNVSRFVTYEWTPGNQTTLSISNLVPGDYTLTVRDGGDPNNPCVETAVFTVPRCTLSTDAPDYCTPLTLNLGANLTQKCSTDPTAIDITVNDPTTMGGCGDYNVESIGFAPAPVDVADPDLQVHLAPQGPTSVGNLSTEEFDGPYSLDFEFNYYCRKYRFYWVSLHGYVAFSETADATLNDLLLATTGPNELRFDNNIPSANVPNNIVAINFAPLSSNSGGTIVSIVEGTAPNRRVVITYSNVWFLFQDQVANGSTFSGQIIINENGVVEMHVANSPAVANVNVNLGPPQPFSLFYEKTMGLENFDGSVAHPVNARVKDATWTATNEGWRFTPRVNAATLRYEWFDATNAPGTPIAGQTNPTISRNPTDTTRYIVRVYHERSCFTQDTIDILVDAPPTPGTVQADQTVCPNINSGSMTLTGFVGQIVNWETRTVANPVFTPNPTPNTTATQTFTNLTQNTEYRAQVRNGQCPPQPSTSATVTLAQPDVNFTTVSNISCFGLLDGILEVDVTGGVAPYTFRWTRNGNSMAPTTPRIENLAVGNYCITVTDVNGCTANACQTLTQPNRLDVSVVRVQNVSCASGADGSIEIAASGGNGGYVFQWTGPNGFSSGNRDIFNLASGFYSVTVTDSRGCVASFANIQVTEPTPIVVTVTNVRDVTCFGDSDGEIQLTVQGGTPFQNRNPDYDFAWSDVGLNVEDRTGLSAGTYDVAITDAAGCRVDRSFTVGSPGDLVMLDIQETNPSCFGRTDGQVQVRVEGGTQDYTFRWNDANATDTEDLPDVGAGSYCLTVTDANNCTASRCFTLVNPPQLSVSITAVASPSCFGGADGGLTASATGGVGGYQYSWTGNRTGATISSLQAGDYCVSVEDANGCTAEACTTLAQPSAIAIDLDALGAVSCTGRQDGFILVDVSGGTLQGDPVPVFGYSWTGPGGYTSTQEDIENLGPGAYCLTAVNASGCTAQRCFTVTEPAPLAIAVNSVVDPLCNGLSTGVVDVSVTGGTAPYVRTWRGPNGFTTTVEDLVNVPAGDYTLQVIDARGCEATEAVTIDEPDALEIELLLQVNVSCGGGNDGYIGIDELGGTPDYHYVWSRAGETDEELNNLTAGTYCVTLTDDAGCRVEECYTITEPAVLTATGVVSPVACNGGATGGVTLTVTGGTGAYSFVWSAGPAGGPEVTRTQNLTNAAAGEYCVQVTDERNCSVVECFTVTEPAAITVVSETVVPVRCNGQNNGSIQVTASGGTAPLSYSWTRNGVPFGSAQPAIGGLTAGSYVLRITDGNACFIERTYDLTDPALLTASIVAQGDVSCRGGNDGFLEAAASGGDGVYTYRWLHNGWPQARIPGLTAGGYTVEVLDGQGCRATASGIVSQPQALVLTVNQITPVNCFDEATGRIDVTVTGGTEPYGYSWAGPNGYVSVDADISDLRAGRYQVTVTDANGCRTTASNLNVAQPSAALSVSVLTFSNPRCSGVNNGSVLVMVAGGTAPYTYIWDGAVAGNTPSATGLGGGLYCVRVIDALGCERTVCQQLVEPEELRIEFNRVSPISCSGAGDGGIYPDVFGGTEPYQYRWTGTDPTYNSFLEFLENVGPNRYCLQVRDVNGCEVVECLDLTQPAAVTATLVRTRRPSCFGGSDGEIEVSASGGDGSLTLSWVGPNGFSSDQPVLVGLSAGTYHLLVSDGNGCTGSLSVTLLGRTALSAVSTVVPVQCPGESTGTVIWTVSGGAAPYSYSWSDDATRTGSSASQLPVGCLDLRVTDGFGCQATFNACVTGPEPFVFDGEALPAACSGDSNGGVSMVVSGGTPPYQFLWSNGATTESVWDLPAGSYTLSVRDARGCQALSPAYDVTQPEALTVTEDEVTDVTCAGLADGSLRVRVEGGVEPYRYFWAVPGSGEVERPDFQNLNGLSAGEYCLRAVDANNCEARLCLTVDEPDSIRITLDQITGVACASGSDGSVEVTVTGGVEPYDFVWSDAAGSLTEDLSGVPNGTYCLEVSDANGCQARSCFDVPLEGLPATIEGLPATVCASAAAVDLTGLPGGGTFSGPGITGSSFSPDGLEPGVYAILYEFTDEGGCLFQARQDVEVLAGPAAASLVFGGLPAGPPFCQSVTTAYTLTYAPLQADVTASASGPGVRQTGGGFVFRPILAGAGEHELVLTLRSAVTGCERVIRDTVEVGRPVTLAMTPSTAEACPGAPVSVTLTGATSYEWSPSTGVVENAVGDYTLSAQATTTYTATGVSGGCRNSRTFRLTIRPVTPVDVQPGETVSVCEGASVELRAVSAGDYTYEWSPADELSATTGAAVTATPTASRTYTVTATPGNGGCPVIRTVDVTVVPAGVTVSADRSPICPGEMATLTAVGVPAGAYTFTWAPSAGLSAVTGDVVTASPLATTVYTVTRSGAGECLSATVEVEVVDGGATISGLLASYCRDADCVDLTAAPAGGTFSGPGVSGTQFCPGSVPAGTPVALIRYDGTAGGCAFSGEVSVVVETPVRASLLNVVPQYCIVGNPVFLVPSVPGSVVTGPVPGFSGGVFNPREAGAGFHSLTVTAPDAGCFADSVIQVEVVDPQVSIQGLSAAYCVSGAAVTLTGLPAGGAFKLTPARAGALVNGVFNPAAAGVGQFLITYSGTDGPCTYSTTVPVQVLPNITAAASAVSASEPNSADGIVTVSVTGGRAPFQYSIDGGSTWQASPAFTGLFPGTYQACARDAVGCQSCVSATVDAGAPLCNRPANVRVVSVSEREATLAWDAAANAVGYVVEWREQVSSLVRTVSVASPTAVLTGLTPGAVHVFTVRTDCGGGNESPLTDEAFFETPSGCGAPAVVGVVPQSTGAVVSWPSVAGATSYQVSWRPASGGPLSTATTTATNLTLTGLSPLTAYVVEVRTVCGTAQSGGASAQFTTQPAAEQCAVPANLRVENVGPTTATVRWTPVSGATGYVIAWRRTVTGSPWLTVTLTGGALDLFRLTNLLPGAGYEVRIRTRCGSSLSSSWSSSVAFATSAQRASSVSASSFASVYPNPNRGRFTVSVGGPSIAAAKLSVFDLAGRSVWTGELPAGAESAEIELDSPAAGLYFLRVQAPEGEWTVKVVVE